MDAMLGYILANDELKFGTEVWNVMILVESQPGCRAQAKKHLHVFTFCATLLAFTQPFLNFSGIINQNVNNFCTLVRN